MDRRKLDRLLATGGLVLTIVLIVGATLLFVGYRFTTSQVTDQLTAQKVFFPPAGSDGLADPRIGPFINRYAGQQLTTGPQAEAYANHYIGVHLQDTAGGKTYSEVSTLSRENPDDEELAGQVQTLFRGETLRGLLLTASAFWKLGQIALLGSIAALGLAGIMLVLTILGFGHARRLAQREADPATTSALAHAA